MQKKHLKKLYLILAGSVLIISGCGKDGSATTNKKFEYIAASIWKYSDVGLDRGDGTIGQALPSALDLTCVKDNTITFKADKTGSTDEGATKCDPTSTNPRVTSFTWTLNSSDTLTLSTPLLSIAGFPNAARVREVTDSKFVLSTTINYSGIPFPIVVVLVH